MSALRSIGRQALREKRGLAALRSTTAKTDEQHIRAAMASSKPVRKLVRRVGVERAALVLRAESNRREAARLARRKKAAEAPK